MATTIRLLRSDISQQRPDPGVIVNGTPMLNIHESEPGLFFAARDGSLVKVGPASVGNYAPNSFPQGFLGNCIGELWVDTSGTDPDLKFFDGSDFVSAYTAPTAVTSVGLSFSDLFSVSNSPVTTTGTLTATLNPQLPYRVFAGPASGSGGTPSFRALVAGDIPAISASKITSGVLDQGRIPNLSAAKITSGSFPVAVIPDLDASKITSGVFSFTRGGTGISATPDNGELLIGNGASWTKATLSAGANLGITNGSGSITLTLDQSPRLDGVRFLDSTGDELLVHAPSITIPYTLKLPVSDGTNGAILTTDGGGQLSFQTSLFGLASIGGAGSLTINAGGLNGDVILAPTGSGTISASSYRISDVAAPSAGTDAANKAYVDTIAAGIQPKAQVDAASTVNIDLATGGLITVDTVVLTGGERVLVKDQTLPEENGIYIAAAGPWSRAADTNTFSELVGATTFVGGGSVNLTKTFLCDSPAGGTIGVDPVNWVLFSSGVGTVTSVGLAMPSGFTVTNSPVTSSGTLTVAWNTQTANKVFAGPASGGAAAPTFRVLAAADIPAALTSHTFSGSVGFQADVDLGDDASDLISVNGVVDTDIIPTGAVSLGSATDRWDNVYTNDLHLSNEGHSNDVDGTWGSYTIQEGEEELYLINRRNGKRYKFLLQEV